MQLGTSGGVFTNWGATLFSFFNANVSGNYTFHVASDNGAQLYLNSSLLIDNSGKSYLYRLWRLHSSSHVFTAMLQVTIWMLVYQDIGSCVMHKAVDAMPSNSAINVCTCHACCCRLQCLFCTVLSLTVNNILLHSACSRDGLHSSRTVLWTA